MMLVIRRLTVLLLIVVSCSKMDSSAVKRHRKDSHIVKITFGKNKPSTKAVIIMSEDPKHSIRQTPLTMLPVTNSKTKPENNMDADFETSSLIGITKTTPVMVNPSATSDHVTESSMFPTTEAPTRIYTTSSRRPDINTIPVSIHEPTDVSYSTDTEVTSSSNSVENSGTSHSATAALHNAGSITEPSPSTTTSSYRFDGSSSETTKSPSYSVKFETSHDDGREPYDIPPETENEVEIDVNVSNLTATETGFDVTGKPSSVDTRISENRSTALHPDGDASVNLTSSQNQRIANISSTATDTTQQKISDNDVVAEESKLCDNSGNGRLQYVWGDAFSDTDCLGPNMQKYPTELVERMFEDKWKRLRHKRDTTKDPFSMRSQLLHGWLVANRDYDQIGRMMKSKNEFSTSEQVHGQPQLSRCPGKVRKLCKSDYNTTAPIFGMSMTTGQPVAIVQKFPDLLQQVIYEVCLSDECAVVHGKCTNTYIPYLFLTIPLGPVTLTGQDYILVESGCSCKPDP